MIKYVSVDIESDGPIPGENSMISLGAVIFTESDILNTFEINLHPLPEASQDPNTMTEFWAKNPEAWEYCTSHPAPPDVAMDEFDAWLSSYNGKKVFVAYPLGFDFTFTHYYFHRFLGRDPFGFSGLDLKTLAMALLKLPFRETTKRRMPKEWFKGSPKHNHTPAQDAMGQAILCQNMLKELGGS